MKVKYLIYGLIDSRNDDIFYIGQSSLGLKRPKYHFYPCILKKLKSYVYNKIRYLQKLGYNPYFVILEEVDSIDLLNATEKYYINLYKREGNNLCNLTAGGGGTYGRKVSEKTKKLMSKKYKGRKLSNRTKVKISKAKKGIKLLEETKHKILLNSPKRKPIICIETQEIFDSIRQASKKYKCDFRGIARCCKGEYKQCINKHWKYLEEFKGD